VDVEPARGEVGVAAVVAACFLVVTVTEAVPGTPSNVAVTIPLPAVVNVNVTGLPVVGGNVPSEDDTVQLGVTATVFPYWSLPVALNDCWPPTRTWARAGDTAIDASGPASTVSVWVPLL
jgi:hypothetical protein